MKKTTFALIATLTCTFSDANMLLNGSFELNSFSTDMYNLTNTSWNAGVQNSTAFGAASELDIIKSGSFYGPIPQQGIWKAALHSHRSGNTVDAFTLNLSNPLLAGHEYTLSFSASSYNAATGPGMVNIGISQGATTFGSQIFSTLPIPFDTWTTYSSTFTPVASASFLSIQSVEGNNGWSHVDDFNLEATVPEPSTMLCFGLGIGLFKKARRAKTPSQP